MLAEMYIKARLCSCQQLPFAATCNSNTGSISIEIARKSLYNYFQPALCNSKGSINWLAEIGHYWPITSHVLSPLGPIKCSSVKDKGLVSDQTGPLRNHNSQGVSGVSAPVAFATFIWRYLESSLLYLNIWLLSNLRYAKLECTCLQYQLLLNIICITRMLRTLHHEAKAERSLRLAKQHLLQALGLQEPAPQSALQLHPPFPETLGRQPFTNPCLLFNPTVQLQNQYQDIHH